MNLHLNPEYTDWNLIWKRMKNENELAKKSGNCASFWSTVKDAEEYYTAANKDGGRLQYITDSLPVKKSSNVLDIGAGPGTIAVPLSEKVAEITAVEPSAAMIEVLKNNILKHNIHNINCTKKLWEEIDIKTDLNAPYDVVFAANSLGMHDLKSAVQKMQKVSSAYVVLFHFSGLPYWEQIIKELWPEIHGTDYMPGPKANIIYNLLYQLEIYPDIEVFSEKHTLRYESIDEMTEEYSKRLLIKTDRQRKKLKKLLSEKFAETDAGVFVSANTNHTKIMWKTEN